MKGRIVHLGFLSMLLMLSLTGCKKGLSDFAFSYTMESVENYKVVLTVNSDRSYRLDVANYYMAKQSGQFEPKVAEGTLTDAEFNAFSHLLGETDFFAMKDSYGFEADASELNIMYQVYFKTGGKDKYISIRDSEANKFPASFLQLLEYINTFIGEHKVG